MWKFRQTNEWALSHHRLWRHNITSYTQPHAAEHNREAFTNNKFSRGAGCVLAHKEEEFPRVVEFIIFFQRISDKWLKK